MDAVPAEIRAELVRLIMRRADDDCLRAMRTTSRMCRDLATAELEERGSTTHMTARAATATVKNLHRSKMMKKRPAVHVLTMACKYGHLTTAQWLTNYARIDRRAFGCTKTNPLTVA